ncbi:MAG: hypothetical protein IPK19_40585 [Chloroflexi bacterium]|nr:hypothetical protein [Chloroflexota bacterium]
MAVVALSGPAPDQLRCEVALDTGDRVSMASWLAMDGADWIYREEGRAAFLSATLPCPAGQTLTFEKRTAVTSSFDRGALDLETPAVARHAVRGAGREHAAVWASAGPALDVVIETDPTATTGRSSPCDAGALSPDPGASNDNRVAIDPRLPAMPIAACASLGHGDVPATFFLYTDPARGKMLTGFRIGTLDGARKNAASFGYGGARYPGKATSDGIERCPNWQYRDHEVRGGRRRLRAGAHRPGDRRRGLLEREAAGVPRETAAYWLERVDWRPGRITLACSA